MTTLKEAIASGDLDMIKEAYAKEEKRKKKHKKVQADEFDFQIRNAQKAQVNDDGTKRGISEAVDGSNLLKNNRFVDDHSINTNEDYGLTKLTAGKLRTKLIDFGEDRVAVNKIKTKRTLVNKLKKHIQEEEKVALYNAARTERRPPPETVSVKCSSCSREYKLTPMQVKGNSVNDEFICDRCIGRRMPR